MIRLVRTVGSKLLWLAVTLLVTSFMVFGSLYLVPGDPTSFLVKGQGRTLSPAQLASLREQFGFDKPFFERYFTWLGNAIQGDFGQSFQFRESVSLILEARIPTTLGLITYSAILVVLFGLALGAIGALNRGKTADRAVQIGTTVFSAIPPFVAAILLVSVFSVSLGWFPTFSSGEGFWQRIHHLTLPAIALSITFVATVARITRSSMIDQLGREHVEVSVSRGTAFGSVVRRHVLRNSVNPILTISAVVVAGLLVSSAIVETAFGLNGVGSLLIKSVDQMDFPVVQAVVLLIVAVFAIVNTLVDLLQPLIDPRLRFGEAGR